MVPRRWFTRRAFLLALLVAVCVALGSIVPVFVGVGLALGLALAIAVVADLALIPGSARVRVARETPARFTLGEAGAIVYHLENTGSLPLRLGVLETPVDLLRFDERATLASIGPRSARDASSPLVPVERGSGTFVGFAAWWETPLGLVRAYTAHDAAVQFRVWPDLRALVQHGTLAQRRRTIDLGLRRLRRTGIGSDFESLREYVPGDAFRSIAWQATARRGKTIVVERTIERSQNVVLALDAGRLMTAPVAGQRKFDYALTAALILASRAAQADDKVGLLAFAGGIVDYVAPAARPAHAALIARRIADLQPRFEEADYEGAFAYLRRHQTKRSLVVVFTDMFDPVASAALLGELASLARRHLIVVVMMNDEAIAQALSIPPVTVDDAYRASVAATLGEERRRAALLLARRGIGVIDVPAPDLGLALVNRYIEIKTRGAI